LGREAFCSLKSRLDKLGIKTGMRVCTLAVPDAEFELELAGRLGAPPAKAARGRFDAILRGFEAERDLAAIQKLRDHLEAAGALWLIYRKGKAAPLPERSVREALLAAGLVDIKVVAFSDSHTALKAVIPRKLRNGMGG
jgi:hypothetical protein